tara:strand:+ start:846 stop:1097 length:252 start_codon:yes stop_codon:yes gene_type:complete
MKDKKTIRLKWSIGRRVTVDGWYDYHSTIWATEAINKEELAKFLYLVATSPDPDDYLNLDRRYLRAKHAGFAHYKGEIYVWFR